MEAKVEFTPIGEVLSADRPEGGNERFVNRRETIRIYPEYVPGLTDLAPGDRILLLFHFHLSKDYDLITFARGCQKITGVFNSHSPRRPNGIGITEVSIVSLREGELVVDGGDLLPGTPILDIKPA